jgi:hypothetical protein
MQRILILTFLCLDADKCCYIVFFTVQRALKIDFTRTLGNSCFSLLLFLIISLHACMLDSWQVYAVSLITSNTGWSYQHDVLISGIPAL